MLIIQVLMVILNIIEAKLEAYVIGSKDPKYNVQEHRWSAIYYVFLCGIIAYLMKDWTIIPLLLIIRRIFFQEALNIFRKKKLFYLGESGMDKIQSKIFGKNAGVIGFIICILLLILGNIFL